MNTESLSVLAGRPANNSAITFRRVFDLKSEVARAFRQRHQADIMSVLRFGSDRLLLHGILCTWYHVLVTNY